MIPSVSLLLGKIRISNRVASWLLKLVSAAIIVFLFAPVFIVIALSFTPEQTPTFPIPGFSLKWYRAFIHNEAMIEALVLSLEIAIVSTIFSGIIGSLAAFGMVRGNFKNSFLDESSLRIVFSLPLLIPWVIIGIGGLIFFNLIGLFGTFRSYIIGHILITLPFPVLVVAAGLDGFDRRLEEAAKNLGAKRWRVYYEVTLPMILPSIVAAMLFAFILSFNNFIQTFFWLSFADQTLPVDIFGRLQRIYDPSINAIGTLLIVFSLMITITAERLSGRLLT